MMKEGLLERIQNVGYWRVNVRPRQRLPQPLTFARCQEIVSQTRVSIRGWDFPHISNRQDDEGGEARGTDYYENWCDWWNQMEFWRMYRSGQFISYNALWEDVVEDKTPSPRGTLEILDTIYSVSEFLEFSNRLLGQGIYDSGVNVNISLHNTAGRRLSTGPRRMPFFDEKKTDAKVIEISRDISFNDGSNNYLSIAADMLLEFFDYFGWNPARSQIVNDQERFFRREFG